MTQKIHEVDVLKFDEKYFYLQVDGQAYRLAWDVCSKQLASASEVERKFLEVSPSGYGIHWPLIDEDLAITPLLERAKILDTPIGEV